MGKSVFERAQAFLAEHGREGKQKPRRKRAAPGRHTRKCNVCRHPDRDAIEQDFLRWRSPDRIAKDYGIADHSSVYRHVHATGLFARRRATIRLALEPLIERAETVKVTANAIVSAVRVYAHLNDAGEWIEPATSHSPLAPALSHPNRQTVRTEHVPTR